MCFLCFFNLQSELINQFSAQQICVIEGGRLVKEYMLYVDNSSHNFEVWKSFLLLINSLPIGYYYSALSKKKNTSTELKLFWRSITSKVQSLSPYHVSIALYNKLIPIRYHQKICKEQESVTTTQSWKFYYLTVILGFGGCLRTYTFIY